MLRGRLDHRVDFVAMGDVGLQRDGALRTKFRGDRLGGCAAAPVVQHDLRAGIRECTGDRHAEPAPGAGDQHDLMFELHDTHLRCGKRPM